MPVRRLLIAGIAFTALAGIVAALLVPFEGNASDERARDRAYLSAADIALNWHVDVNSWAKAAATEAAPAPTPALPQPAAPTDAPAPPAAAADTTAGEPPTDAAPPQQPQPPPPTPTPPVEWLDTDFSARVLAVLNGVRQANGVQALSTNNALSASAERFSDLLTQLSTLDHGTGGDLLARVQAAGFLDPVQVGEVLWYGTGTSSPGDPVNAWMGSPGHHEIILDPVYRQAGVGCYFRNSGGQLEGRCVVEVAG